MAPLGILLPMRAGRARAFGAALLVSVFLAAGRAGASQPTCPPRPAQAGVPGRADYRIQVRYEEEPRLLAGSETVVWTNTTSVAAGELWFHLYWNGFANDRSTHLVESRGSLRGIEVGDGWGWQRVKSVRALGRDLLPSFRYRQPDDGNVEDRSVFSVELPEPVAPGASIEVALEWDARIPKLRRRTGYKGDFLFIAHWFPKLGVFEGERGWNCHQFHASTEFFADYGTYDVALDLPVRYMNRIGASGALLPPQEQRGERVVARFLAPSFRDRQETDAHGRPLLVHDFAWTADPDFKIRQPIFQYDRWARRFDGEVELARKAFGPGKDLSLRSVTVRVLMQAEREKQWERHYEATCAALFFYGLWFGGYPYEEITVVDPAWGGGAAGGMEYPTLFTAGTRLFTTEDMHSPEGVTVHECGHQFWYGLVGNNEFESAWLDEGFNSYTDSEALFRRYGLQRATSDYAGYPFDGVAPAPGPGGRRLSDFLCGRRLDFGWIELQPLRRSGFFDLWRDQPWLTNVAQRSDPRWSDRSRYVSDPDRDPIDTPGWLYADARSYRVNSYQRPALALRTLRSVVGPEAFLRGMRHYSDTWRFRHPRPDDFFRAFIEGSGVDVSWFFDEAFRSTATVDWKVDVEQRLRGEPAGFFQEAPGAEFALRGKDSPARAGEAQGEASADSPAAPGPPQEKAERKRTWSSEVLITRKGEMRLPLPIELRFEGGRTERRLWTREEQAQERWLAIVLEGEEKLEAVRLDPDRECYLDLDLRDNQWYAQKDRIAPVRWTERVFTRWLHLLHWQAGIGG